MKKNSILKLCCISLLLTHFFNSYSVSASAFKEEVIRNAKNPTISQKGNSFAYTKYMKDTGWYVIVNGVDNKGWMPIENGKIWMVFDSIKDLSFSSDGKSLVYQASEEASYNKYESLIVQDGKFIDSGTYPVISPDGKHLAYISQNGSIVKDGIELPETKNLGYRYITSMLFSPDGKSFAYKVVGKYSGYMVVKDGNESEEFYDVSNLTYSPDGKSFSYDSNSYSGKLIIKDGVALNQYGESQYPTYSPNGKSFAYVGMKNGKAFVVKDGNKGPEYDKVQHPSFSPNGKSFAYVAVQRGKSFIVLNGVKSKEYRDINSILFSPDGKNIAYVADFELYVNGKKVKYSLASKPKYFFTPDGKKFIYSANIDEDESVVRITLRK